MNGSLRYVLGVPCAALRGDDEQASPKAVLIQLVMQIVQVLTDQGFQRDVDAGR